MVIVTDFAFGWRACRIGSDNVKYDGHFGVNQAHTRMQANSVARLHGTFVAGILSPKRNSPAPAICPDCTLAQPSTKGEQDFEEALHQAVRRGVIVVAAPGNQGALGGSAITRPPWVISMVACDLRGRLIRSHPNCHRTRTG